MTAKEDVLEELSFFNIRYKRARDDSSGIKRGNIFIGNRMIPHYPQIGRILSLKKGIQRNFKEKYAVEEKYDGYNVRVFSYRGEIFAATRGGILCPFTIERLKGLTERLEAFFNRFPLHILVGEVVGHQNPYMDVPTTYELSRDAEIFFFDIMDEKGEFILPENRRNILAEFELPQVPLFGVFSANDADIKKVYSIVETLNTRRREGIVIKSTIKKGKYLKYVTPVINLMDIKSDALLMSELPGNFFTSRIIRYVISSMELGIKEQVNFRELFINGFEQAIWQVEEKGYVYRELVLFFRERRNLDEFLRIFRRISKHIKIDNIKITYKNDGYVLSFRKIFLDSTKKLRDFLKGKYLYD